MNLTLCFQFFILFQKTHEKTLEFFGTETFETYEKTLEKKRSDRDQRCRTENNHNSQQSLAGWCSALECFGTETFETYEKS